MEGTTRDSDALRQHALSDLGYAYLELQAAQRKMRGRDAKQQHEELSFAQFTLLQPLGEHDELPSGELAAKAGLTPATTTHMLDQLANAGVVERRRSDRDRRIVITRLTRDGRARYERKRNKLREAWTVTMEDLSADGLTEAAAAVRRIAAFLASL